jgi:hypothetical protein
MRRRVLAVLSVTVLAGCGGGGAHDQPRATIVPPTPTGDPASAALQQALTDHTRSMTPGWAALPIEPAQAVQVASSGGDELYYAPAGRIWCVGLVTSGQLANTACTPRSGPRLPLEASWSGDPIGRFGNGFRLYGWASAPATRAELVLGDGSSRPIPLQQGFFLLRTDSGLPSRPAELRALDDAGNVVATRPLMSEELWRRLQGPPEPAAVSRQVTVPLDHGQATVGIDAAGACSTFSVHQTDSTAELSTGAFGGFDDSEPAVSIMALQQLTVVTGTIGDAVSSAWLHLSDGTDQTVAVNARCVFASVAASDDTAARHPASLRWQDGSGTQHELPVEGIWPQFYSDM